MRVVWSLPVPGTRSAGSRGDVVRARRLAEGLRAEGHDVWIVGDGVRLGAELAVGAYRRGVRRALPGALGLVARDAGRYLHARAHARRVASEAGRRRADVIVETQVHFSDSGARAARATGLPLVLDDCSPVAEELGFGVGIPRLARALFERQLEEAARVVVSSRQLRYLLLEDGAREESVRIVPNGVDLGSLRTADRSAERRRLGIDDRIVVGFVGSFQPWHRVDLLVEAMATLDRLPLHLVLVGDGPGRERTRAAARRAGLEGRISELGPVDPALVPRLTAAFDIGALPGTNRYGHPMKLLEYAAAGLPVVAADLPPVRDVLRDGETGLLVPPGDAAALAAAIRRLTADPELRRRLGRSARARITESSSWRGRARGLVEGL